MVVIVKAVVAMLIAVVLLVIITTPILGKSVHHDWKGTYAFIRIIFQMALDTSHWTWINHFFIWGSIIFYFLFTFTTYSALFYNLLPSQFPDVGAAVNTFGTGNFWAALFLTAAVSLLPVIGFRWTASKLYPTLSDLIRRGAWKKRRSRPPVVWYLHHNYLGSEYKPRFGFVFRPLFCSVHWKGDMRNLVC